MGRLGVGSIDIAALWRDFRSAHFSFAYPIAGFFCECFLAAFGKARFLELLRHQEYQDAREFFGDGAIDSVIRNVENALNRETLPAFSSSNG